MKKAKVVERSRVGAVMVELTPQLREKLEAIRDHRTATSGMKYNLSDVLRTMISDEFERMEEEQ